MAHARRTLLGWTTVVLAVAAATAAFLLFGDGPRSPGPARADREDGREPGGAPLSGTGPVLEAGTGVPQAGRVPAATGPIEARAGAAAGAPAPADAGPLDPQRLPGPGRRIALSVGVDAGWRTTVWHPNWSLPHGATPSGKPFRLSGDGKGWRLEGLSANTRWACAALLENEKVIALARPVRVGADGAVPAFEWIPSERLATLRLAYAFHVHVDWVHFRVRWGEAEIGPVQLLPAGEVVWLVPAETDIEVSVGDWSRAEDLPFPAPQQVRLAPGEERRVTFTAAGARLARVHAVDAAGKRQVSTAYVWRLDDSRVPRPWSETPGWAEEHRVNLVPGRYGAAVHGWMGSGWRAIDVGPGFDEGADVDVVVEPVGRRLRVTLDATDHASLRGEWAFLTSLDAASPREWFSARLYWPEGGLLETPLLAPGPYLLSVRGCTLRLENGGPDGPPKALPRLPAMPTQILPNDPGVGVVLRDLPKGWGPTPLRLYLERTGEEGRWGYLAGEANSFRPLEPGPWRVIAPASWWWPGPTEAADIGVTVGPRGHHRVELRVPLRR